MGKRGDSIMTVEDAVKLNDWLRWFMNFMYFRWLSNGNTDVAAIPDAVWNAKFSLSYRLTHSKVVIDNV